jgi:hypothetical protein
VVQQRRLRGRGFAGLLQQVVGNLEAMQADERLRWLELLSYLQALVYHDRAEAEQQNLSDLILTSVRTDEHRQELSMARQTMADVHRQEGEQRGAIRSQQQTLTKLLTKRFGPLPPEVQRAIQGTTDPSRLDNWTMQVLDVTSLADMGIGTES